MSLFESHKRYTNPQVIGSGGVGTVFKVFDKKLGRHVAVKVLNSVLIQDEDRKRFEREARSMAQLQHSHICSIHDFDCESYHPFLVMDLIEGQSLDKILQSQWPIPPKTVAHWLLQIGKALAHAHSRRVYHRDLKPQNIMINLDSDAILMDFGLAKCVGASDSLTKSGGFMGTPAYAPPEQFSDARHVDHRADIYSLGIVLYELLCRRLPFEGEFWTVVRQKMTNIEIKAPSEFHPELDSSLETVCLKAAKLNPTERYQAIVEFSQELELYLDGDVQVKGAKNSTVTKTPSTTPIYLADLPARPAPAVIPFDKATAEEHQDKEALLLGRQRSWINSIGMDMTVIPRGEFIMGSPSGEFGRDTDEEQTGVNLNDPFSLGQCVITQRQWNAVMGTEPWQGGMFVKEGDDYPATYVNWNDATEFCAALTAREHTAGSLPTTFEYTLPTEAQWEFACRAGTKSLFSFGDDFDRIKEAAYYDENAWDIGEVYSHEVGTKIPNAFHLFDMHGNVWEWCRDWYLPNLPGGADPLVVKVTANRVVRGGSWRGNSGFCRSANRHKFSPTSRLSELGFRVAVVPIG